MNKNTGIIVGVVVLVLVVGGVYISMNNKESSNLNNNILDSDMEGSPVLKREEVDMTSKTMKESDAVMKMGIYEAYSADKLARAETGDVVLFFHASWCPSCRGLNSSIESNLKSIPEGVTILKTDYDKEIDLKKKYGVTYQHTLVQVDKDGKMIKKWSGSSSLNNLLSQIQ